MGNAVGVIVGVGEGTGVLVGVGTAVAVGIDIGVAVEIGMDVGVTEEVGVAPASQAKRNNARDQVTGKRNPHNLMDSETS